MPPLRRARREIDYSQFCDVLDDCSGSDDDYERSPSPPPVKIPRSKLLKRKRHKHFKQKTGTSSSTGTSNGPSSSGNRRLVYRAKTPLKPLNSAKVTLSTVSIYEYQDRACPNGSGYSVPDGNESQMNDRAQMDMTLDSSHDRQSTSSSPDDKSGSDS